MRPDPDRLDWRWHHASAATELTDAQALGWLSGCDEIVHQAYRFKRSVDRGLWSEDDVTWRAYHLWSNIDKAPTRIRAECQLLTDYTIDQIARENRTTPEVIQRFHDLFFDVLPAIADGAGKWVTGQLFRNGTFVNVHSKDEVGRMHRIAWMFGPRVIDCYLDTGFRNMTGDLKRELFNAAQHYLARLTPLNVMSLAGRGDLDVEILRIALDDMNDAIAKKVEEQQGKGSGESIMTFLKGLAVSVADPTDPRNLELSAREPRAAELIATTARELVPV